MATIGKHSHTCRYHSVPVYHIPYHAVTIVTVQPASLAEVILGLKAGDKLATYRDCWYIGRGHLELRRRPATIR